MLIPARYRSRRRRALGVTALLLSVAAPSAFFASPAVPAEEVQVIAGAGPSTKLVKEFVKHLAGDPRAKGFTFQVPDESIKHQGGIENAGKFLFGRTGRPLNDQEKAAGHAEIILAKMPVVFVAGKNAGIRTLTADQVCSIYTGAVTNWKEVGGNDQKIVLINREPSEAVLQQLKLDLPCMTRTAETKYVLKNDDHVVEMLKTMELGRSAIGFGAAANFPEAIRLAVVGLQSGVRLGLVYRSANRSHPLVQAAIDTVGTAQWLVTLKEMSFAAPEMPGTAR